ncbi:MAG: hypothetical protein RMI56_01575 [Sulfolobales archaeon]|nr:hypothetical protein [Sulfolobales archaeon]MDW8082468.1 hypothetical protein [Sulfolobales archaeon]
MKTSRYLKLLKMARYTPIVVLAISTILNGSGIGTTGVRIPKGEDPSVL